MQSKIHFLISFDPPRDGNCQFSAVCHELMKMGIFRSAETLRKEIVLFLESNPNSADGTPLELFSGTPWAQYLQSMARNGAFGDHITLQAIANLFNVQLVIYSTLGTLATQTITPVNGCPIATFYLGHFAEGAGEHYVCLVDDRQETSAANELNVSHSLMDEAEVPHGNQETEKEDDDDEDASDKNCETQAHEKADEAESVPYLNPDVLEKVIKATLKTSPQMRQTLRAVSRFFQRVVDSVPLPQIYIPELEDYSDIRHVSLRRIIKMKGKNSGVVIALRQLMKITMHILCFSQHTVKTLEILLHFALLHFVLLSGITFCHITSCHIASDYFPYS